MHREFILFLPDPHLDLAKGHSPSGSVTLTPFLDLDRCSEHLTNPIISIDHPIYPNPVPHSGTEDFDLSLSLGDKSQKLNPSLCPPCLCGESIQLQS